VKPREDGLDVLVFFLPTMVIDNKCSMRWKSARFCMFFAKPHIDARQLPDASTPIPICSHSPRCARGDAILKRALHIHFGIAFFEHASANDLFRATVYGAFLRLWF